MLLKRIEKGTDWMLFEVYKDGQGKFMCSDTSCLPTESQLKSMNKNGYEFKLNGKNATLKSVLKLIEK